MSLLSPQLQAFSMVAQYKTVHGAANALHMTQTAVTQRIRALEASLKTTLFIRTRRGMKLTAEGEALIRYCHAAQQLEGQTLSQIKGAGIESEIQITIAGPTSIMQSRIIPTCFKVLSAFPQLLIHFDITDADEQEKSLRAGYCQLAVIKPEHIAAEMQSKLLKPEHYVLVCSTQWKGRKLDDILQNERIIDYNSTDQMTFNYLNQFNLVKTIYSKRHFVNRTESIATMIAKGYGYGVLTKEFSETYVQSGQLMILNSGKIYENILALAWYERPEPPAYFSTLLDSIN
jgi:LysR family transcriptional regulator (chromosome initiation inhibitor)